MQLGRLPSVDIRDVLFRLADTAPRQLWDKPARFWTSDETTPTGYELSTKLDQGATGTCVGHAWTHWEQTVRRRPGRHNPFKVYRRAVLVDEWADNDNEATAERSDLQFGTSVRAGAKALIDMGTLQSYEWAWTLETVVETILHKGPVVFGTWWYESMFNPIDGRIVVDGAAVGGHAYLVDGVDTRTGVLRVHNSWGPTWGAAGYGFLSFADAARLLSEQGEACLGIPTPLET